MTDLNKLPLDFFNNPGMVQAAMLDVMESVINEGTITSANGVVATTLEMMADTTAIVTRGIIAERDSLYPKRAHGKSQLYRHMSNYDYVGIFAAPATMDMYFYFDRDYIVENAIQYNDNYKKVVIPAETIVNVAGVPMGIYYPIEIRVNIRSGNIQVSYDMSEPHPFDKRQTNNIEFRESSTINGDNLITIKVPMFQISRVTAEFRNKKDGFYFEIPFKDKFYACRIFTKRDGTMIELEQTLTDVIYDPANPTAKISPLDGKLRVDIPYVYEDINSIGEVIEIEAYTTMGNVDIDLSNLSEDMVWMDFVKTKDNKFSDILTNMKSMFAIPSVTRLTGGSDELSFEELKDRVVHNSFHGDVIITPMDREKYFNSLGFNISVLADGITGRSLVSSRQLKDRQGVPIATAVRPTIFVKEVLDTLSTIKSFNDQSYTILPTTLYRLDGTTQFVPVTDDEKAALESYDKVSVYNNNTLSMCPFHLRLDSDDSYPMAYAYSLNNPSIDNVMFMDENRALSQQLTLYHTEITHLENGTAGYDVLFHVTLSSDLVGIDPDKIHMWITMYTNTNNSTYQKAEYVGTSLEDKLLFKLHLDTTYHINVNNQISISSMVDVDGDHDHYFDLSTFMDITFAVDNSIIPRYVNTPQTVGNSLPPSVSGVIPLVRQRVEFTFGRRIDSLYSKVNVILNDKEFERWEYTDYVKYTSTVYELDENGIPTYTTNPDGTLEFNVLHEIGDIIYDRQTVTLLAENIDDYVGSILVPSGIEITEDNKMDYVGTLQGLDKPYINHRIGDVKMGPDGEPIVLKGRTEKFITSMLHINARISQSTHINQVDHIYYMAADVESYCEVAERAAREDLIETQHVYFVPVTTMGVSKFMIDSVTSIDMPLELTMKLKFYVTPTVMKREDLMKAIRETTIKTIDKHLMNSKISLVLMVNEIVSSMPDMVKSVDVLGVNSYTDLQTLVVTEANTMPVLKQVLTTDSTGGYVLDRALEIEFASPEEVDDRLIM